MTLMSDDGPEPIMSPAVISPDEDFLPVLSGGEGRFSPARAYLLSLNSRIRLFDTLTSDRLTNQAVYHVLQLRQHQARIAKRVPHDLRRTFATAMLDNGEDLISTKDGMGKPSVTTAQQYGQRGEMRLRTVRERLEQI